MKHLAAFAFFFLLAGVTCFAQGPASKAQNAVANSEIRVRIAPFAIIDLAKNSATSVSYRSSSELKDLLKLNPETKVEANNRWSVNIITDNSSAGVTEQKPSATDNPSLTVIYVTTRI